MKMPIRPKRHEAIVVPNNLPCHFHPNTTIKNRDKATLTPSLSAALTYQQITRQSNILTSPGVMNGIQMGKVWMEPTRRVLG